ncbi:Crp/Fnr family transcriptional regulator [Virgibacillus oceani]|uniref:cAMP-binding protein n=1 Tax=Virgibacillus oceani TaxID=1479511 RepID=A0A917M8U6_9BACI|nr:Crp/Fnr family transcriptional regulator [Virgibacillus oceani]GGG86579.1 cAMP-binding protein [Virgibacillus oceani]
MEPLLQRIDSYDYDMLLANSKRKHVKKYEFIFKEGSTAEYLYFIHKGQIRMLKELGLHKEITIFIRDEKDAFGEIGIFSGNSYSNSAQALMDSVLYYIEKREMESIIAQNGKLGLHFTRWIAESLEASKAKIRDFLAFGSEGAIASVFVRYANMYGVVTPSGIRITEAVLIRDISKHIGISRETVSRIVNKWKGQGILANESKYYLIKDITYFKKILLCEKCGVKNCVL